MRSTSFHLLFLSASDLLLFLSLPRALPLALSRAFRRRRLHSRGVDRPIDGRQLHTEEELDVQQHQEDNADLQPSHEKEGA